MAYAHIKPSGGDTGSRLNLFKRLAIIERYTEVLGKKILDCGCGTGQYVLALLQRGAEVYGIEYDSEKVVRCKREHPELTERVKSGNIEAMDYETNSYDIALLNEVLEHVLNENKALHEIHRILKPKGLIVVFSPNRLYPFETHSVSLKHSRRRVPIHIPFVPYIPLSLGRRLFDYVARNYWPHQLRQQIRACGFMIVDTGYVWQTFENISGTQPKIIAALKPILRTASAVLEQTPGIKAFGVSQVVIAQK